MIRSYRFGLGALAGLVLAACLGVAASAGEAIVTVPTGREGVTQSMLVLDPPQPATDAVLLMVGGPGRAALAGHDPAWRGGNFLFRSADQFVSEGLTAAVLDAPSDLPVLWNFRTTSAHAEDLVRAIAFLRARGAARVWVVGTSMGTLSAANVARLSEGGPDGIVLSSTVVKASGQSVENVLTINLSEIAIPVLLVRHREDACHVSLPAGADAVLEKLVHAREKQILEFSGGAPPKSGPCDAFAPHGYYGIEQPVVAAIAGWIRAPH